MHCFQYAVVAPISHQSPLLDYNVEPMFNDINERFRNVNPAPLICTDRVQQEKKTTSYTT